MKSTFQVDIHILFPIISKNEIQCEMGMVVVTLTDWPDDDDEGGSGGD